MSLPSFSIWRKHTWKYDTMRDLHEYLFERQIAYFYLWFLSDSNFKVRVGTSLSDLQDQ